MKTAEAFLDFARRSPTAFQATAALAELLDAGGACRLQETEEWTLAPGRLYYVTRNQSSLIAFRLPESGRPAPFRVIAAHSDSPLLKLKPAAAETVLDHYVRLNVEKYGGAILSTWLDRPLSVAGRVAVRTERGLESRLVDLARDAALIPNLPIHMNRTVNDGYAFNAQVDLLPLYGGSLMKDVAEAAGADPEQVAAADLYLYNRTPGSIWGTNGAYFSSPRIDDLECAWTAVKAFLQAAPAENAIPVCAVFDNEEVGSTSRMGAAGTFLPDVLSRCAAALGVTESGRRALGAAGFMLSADNAHAVHPNHPEKYDADNRCWMNGGVVIKHHAGQKYTTDAVSDAVFGELCRRAGVPVQHFANRSDLVGGSTLGNLAMTQMSMTTVDIGLAQLAMHSCYETAGCDDADWMILAMRTFLEAPLAMTGDGVWRL